MVDATIRAVFQTVLKPLRAADTILYKELRAVAEMAVEFCHRYVVMAREIRTLFILVEVTQPFSPAYSILLVDYTSTVLSRRPFLHVSLF